ncbi:MAG: hypothetical protein ABSH48_15455 [Verrucomicrobiota bacterium]
MRRQFGRSYDQKKVRNTKYPHTFPVMSRCSPEGLPAELGRKLKQHARKDLGGGFKILVDDNDESRPKFQFVVPNASA